MDGGVRRRRIVRIYAQPADDDVVPHPGDEGRRNLPQTTNANPVPAVGSIDPTHETCNGCHEGEDHHTRVDEGEQVNNKEAIHEFKNPPAD